MNESPKNENSALTQPLFHQDLLDRSHHVEKLTKLLLPEPGPFVLSINGPWGSGKTTFVEHIWQKYLDEQGVKYLHFNAWENDHFDYPLVPFIAEMKRSFPRNFDKMSRSAVDIAKAALPVYVPG